MVKFKSWRDSYLFLKEYGSFTCLQCKNCNHNLDTSKEHSDFEYSHFFCTEQIAIVDFSFQFTCMEWENEDGETINESNKDECIFNLPVEVIEQLESKNKKWTIEEIRGLVGGYAT